MSLRRRAELAHHGPADVNIGKKGVTPEVLREIDARLRKKGVVKVKLLKSAVAVEGGDRREIARRVAEALGARLMGIRGRTFVLARPPGEDSFKDAGQARAGVGGRHGDSAGRPSRRANQESR